MELHTIHAIVLRSLPFQEEKRIVTLFSEELGLVAFLLPKGKANKLFTVLSEPFCEAELLLYEGSSSLLHYKEATLLSQHLYLRTNLTYLQTAGSIVQAILHSQLPGKQSPLLYQMLKLFLKYIPQHPSQETLLALFYMKLLKHEGTYHPKEISDGPCFSLQEREYLCHLMQCTSFIEARTCTAELLQRIKELLYLSH